MKEKYFDISASVEFKGVAMRRKISTIYVAENCANETTYNFVVV